MIADIKFANFFELSEASSVFPFKTASAPEAVPIDFVILPIVLIAVPPILIAGPVAIINAPIESIFFFVFSS